MDNNTYYDYCCSTDPYSYNGLDTTSYVDCTLSLGTPSTRSETIDETAKKQSSRRSGSKFCWDLLKKSTGTTSSSTKHQNGGRIGNGDATTEVVMRCANCETSSTPLWRKGPKGPKSLCNACGIRYKKEERRRAGCTTSNGSGASAMDSHHASSEQYYSNQSYNNHNFNSEFPAASNDYDYAHVQAGGGHYEHENGAVAYLPWMADQPSLVHYFTR